MRGEAPQSEKRSRSRGSSTSRPVFSFLLSNNTLEARAFFQRRLTLFAALVAALSAGFYMVGASVSLLGSAERLAERALEPRSTFHLLGLGVAVVVALIAWRRRELEARALEFLDFVCTVSVCACFAMMSLSSPAAVRGDLLVLLATSYTLVIRAAMVPSTAPRSALIGAASFFPAVAVTYLHYKSLTQVPDYIPPALNSLTWSALGTVATASISKVIYGLQRQVTQAMTVGQYTLVERIGEGGMGVVYRATHALLRRPTAIKLLLPEETGPHALARFEREVQLTSQLTHPNTIAIYDFGRTADGIFYYAMEYLDGITLQGLVERHGPQPPARVAHILRQVCGALHEAHLRGLIHRDIKPANIMIGTRGAMHDVVKVLDFGLVRQISRADDREGAKTGTNVILGTPAYLCPEAMTCPAAIDARSDLYALGATAYVLLTGHPVFDGETVLDLCGKHIHEQPKPPSEWLGTALPAGLEGIILQCLQKSQDRRPETAASLADSLAACDAGSWTESDALAWWKERALTSHTTLRALGAGSASTLSIIINVDRRPGARGAEDEALQDVTLVDRPVPRESPGVGSA